MGFTKIALSVVFDQFTLRSWIIVSTYCVNNDATRYFNCNELMRARVSFFNPCNTVITRIKIFIVLMLASSIWKRTHLLLQSMHLWRTPTTLLWQRSQLTPVCTTGFGIKGSLISENWCRSPSGSLSNWRSICSSIAWAATQVSHWTDLNQQKKGKWVKHSGNVQGQSLGIVGTYNGYPLLHSCMTRKRSHNA